MDSDETPRAVTIVGTGAMSALAVSIVESEPRFVLHGVCSPRGDLAEIADADLVVDLSHLDVSVVVVRRALAAGIPVVVGTSGWTRAMLADLADAVRDDAGASVYVVANFAIGSTVISALAALAARYYEVAEIVEIHSDHKPDSPSGTALHTAELISGAREGTTHAPAFGTQPARGADHHGIAVHSLRMPGAPDEQTVELAGDHERARLTYSTTSIEAYRDGLTRTMLAAVPGAGLVVGLEKVIDLGLPG